jgi:hypothetical protein
MGSPLIIHVYQRLAICQGLCLNLLGRNSVFFDRVTKNGFSESGFGDRLIIQIFELNGLINKFGKEIDGWQSIDVRTAASGPYMTKIRNHG